MTKHVEVTATVSTKDRYFTTLPLLLTAVANQTVLPERLIIFDDGEQRDLRSEPLYQGIFSLLQSKLIWEVAFGSRIGQVANHQKALEMSRTEFIWRLDDDQVPESNVLERLFETIKSDEKMGAVGGLVIDPKNGVTRSKVASSKIEDIFLGLNEQWYQNNIVKSYDVDHLYSSFLFRKVAAKSCPTYLSPVGHREETIFTYEMKRHGWRIVIEPRVITWHLHFPSGGIRSYANQEYWNSDDRKFVELLNRWNVKPRSSKLIVLDSGLGDHLIFKKYAWPEIKKKYHGCKIILADCYPEVFEGEDGFIEISIAEALQMGEIEKYNIYKWAWDRNWTKPFGEAYKELYL